MRRGLFDRIDDDGGVDMDKIMISEMEKSDMLLILEALDYTAEKTGIDSYLKLRDDIIHELEQIIGIDSSELIHYLES